MLYWNCGQWHSQSQWQSVWVADIWVTQIGHLGDMPWTLGWDTIGNKSVLKIVINDTMNLFYRTAISILLISNHNSQWVLFDKIASEYFIWKIYLYFSIGNGQPREPALYQLYRHTFVPVAAADTGVFSFIHSPSSWNINLNENSYLFLNLDWQTFYCRPLFCVSNFVALFIILCNFSILSYSHNVQ